MPAILTAPALSELARLAPEFRGDPPRSPLRRERGRAKSYLRGHRGGEAWLDHRVDQLEPLVEGRERALHRVDGEPLDVRPAVTERGHQRGEFRRQRDV